MIITTRAQRLAIKRIYDRQPIYVSKVAEAMKQRVPYKRFRKSVMGTLAMDNAVIVNWAGMWLVIETDGYVHS
jgi:hypothetical protein